MGGKRASALGVDATKPYEATGPPSEICRSISKRQRLSERPKGKEELSHDYSPNRGHNRTPVEIEQMIIGARKGLQKTKYAQIGVSAINRELYLQEISALPAFTIKRILEREELQREKLPCLPKGKAYPTRRLSVPITPIRLIS